MSTEIGLILAPDRTYAALAARATPVGAVRALRRPLLVAIVLGLSTALSTTRHVTPELAASTTILLSVFVVAQVLIASVVIAGPAARGIGWARALDLFFASHAPWSLWIIVSSTIAVPYRLWGVAAVAPAVLTPRMIGAYFREVLGLDRRSAAARTIAHQALTWGVFIAVFGVAVGFWPRILEALS